jgi:flagellar basal-body rod protein FlgF
MQNGLYVALSAQVALERRLETIANNVANMNTVGYRADGVKFEAEIARAGGARVAYVSPGDDFISRRAGGLTKTDNPLDVAVQGDGWLSIDTVSGVAYTRDGRMRISEAGDLQTLNGNAVLDAGGAPIALDPSAGAPAIGADGMINQNGHQVGALGLFAINSEAKLTRAENSSVIPDRPATPILDSIDNGLVQGAVEGANIDPVREMSKLIAVTRTFDGVSTEVTQTETSFQDAIKSLGA